MSVPSNNACNVGVHAHACDYASARPCTRICILHRRVYVRASMDKRGNVLVNASHAAVVAVSPYVGDIFIMSRTNRPSCRIMLQTNADDVMKPANARRETCNRNGSFTNPLSPLVRSVLHKYVNIDV